MTATKNYSAKKVRSHNGPNHNQLTLNTLARFQQIVKKELLFHLTFVLLAAASLIGFAFFFSFLADSFLLGIFIACFFFLVVLYFVLRLYFQEQKPQELVQLRDDYLRFCKQANEEGQNSHDAAMTFASKLSENSIRYASLPNSLGFLAPTIDKLLTQYHWKDIHFFKEIFLRASIDQKVNEVILSPADKTSHSELATLYMALAEHFQAPLKAMNPSSKTASAFWENFQTFAQLAIEELLIVKEYAPADLWACTKLAECYLSLGSFEQAIVEYETILEESPNDPDALFSLGTLYFKQGLHGKGLRAYDQLRQHAPSMADELIALYGFHGSNTFRNIPQQATRNA